MTAIRGGAIICVVNRLLSADLAAPSTLPSNSLKFGTSRMFASTLSDVGDKLMFLLNTGILGTANPMKVPSVTGSERGSLFLHISLGDSCCVLLWSSRMCETLLVCEFSPSWKRRR